MKIVVVALLLISYPAYGDTPSGTEMQIACHHVTLDQPNYTPKEIEICQQWQRKIIKEADDEDVKWTKKIVHEMDERH